MSLCQPLEIEDYLIQPMENASPPKWHIAHVTWFFETFLLKPYDPRYQLYNPAYEVLFNSYYNGVGKQFPRAKRGHLSRPTVGEIISYREYVDTRMVRFMERELSEDIVFAITLGLHHEQQHQELMLTDIKYNFGSNPLLPAYAPQQPGFSEVESPTCFVPFKAGIHEIGAEPSSVTRFSFDNESPRHEVIVGDFEMADRLVTNREYLQFLRDDGYSRAELWLSDAWSVIDQPDGIRCPQYWMRIDDEWFEYTLSGVQPLQLNQPVCHISGYEADAYARWKNARLPTEQEWEIMADDVVVKGNFVESGRYHPHAAMGSSGLKQVFGDAWEWTSSSYTPYPGFREFSGRLGEYNGKFMANQLVLRGGSCATAEDHIRKSYRNFFYPGDRWQFTGIRITRDISI